jgi:polysaccharide export outer membrane protein
MRNRTRSIFVFTVWSAVSTCLIAQQGMTKPVLPTNTQTTETAPAAAGATTETVDNSTYIINPEDRLQVTVWKEAGLTGPVPVRPDGMITLALIGDMRGAGYTPMQLAAEIKSRLKKFIQDPNVTVSVTTVHPKQIFMLGEVAHVGPIILTPTMTPLQAISAAGGLTPFANAKKIYILRVENGKQRKIPFNYKTAIRDGNLQGVSLIPGDTIVVP